MNTEITHIKEGNKIIIRNARVTYVGLAHATRFKNLESSKPRFQISVLLETGSKAHKDFQAALDSVGMENYKRKLAPDATCLKDGAYHKNEAYHKYHIVSMYAYEDPQLSDKGAPAVLSPSKRKIPSTETGDPEYPYAGCYCNVVGELYVTKAFERINGGVKAVQFVARGEALPTGGDSSALVAMLPTLEDLDPVDLDV